MFIGMTVPYFRTSVLPPVGGNIRSYDNTSMASGHARRGGGAPRRRNPCCVAVSMNVARRPLTLL